MKALIYFAVIVGLVPVQSILLSHISLWGLKPDLGFVAVCLIGLIAGEFDGLMVGLALGWAMSLCTRPDFRYGFEGNRGVHSRPRGPAGGLPEPCRPCGGTAGRLLLGWADHSVRPQSQCATGLVVGCPDSSAAASLP
jgi:hypothetical protein